MKKKTTSSSPETKSVEVRIKSLVFGGSILKRSAFAVSCQHFKRLLMDQKATELDEAILLPENEEQGSIAISRPIYQAATKQLISTMMPKGVLCVAVTPDNFKDLGLDFNKFLAVIRGGNQQNLIFYLDELAQDVFTALQGYYQQHPSSMQTIGVEDPIDFLELAGKTGPGAGGRPKSNTEPTRCYCNLDDFFTALGISPNGRLRAEYPWASLSADKMKKALENIPKQVGKVECAANSSARALILCDPINTRVDYETFRFQCPQDIETIYKHVAPFTWGLGMLLAPITAGISVAVAGAIGMATGATETGPSPWELSKYITRYIPRTGCEYKFTQVHSYTHFSNCATDIALDICNSHPVIVFIFWAPTSWHYANVVAVKGNCSRPEGFVILETDRSFDYRTYDNMEHIMYNQYKFNSSFCVGGTPNNYTIIRFHSK